MNYSIYDLTTGEISDLVTFADSESANQNLMLQAHIEGHHDPATHYVKNNLVCERTPDPSNNEVFYKFDANQEQWVVCLDLRPQISRDKRNTLLNDIDRVNPIWYASLTASQQQELQAYRHALLAVPQQVGFPTAIEWPAKPQWL